MNNSIWEKIIDWWSPDNYILPIWHICMLIALIFGIHFYRKEKSYILFFLYVLAGLLFFPGIIILQKLIPFTLQEKTMVGEGCNLLFGFIELMVFYSFFNKIITTQIARVIMKICFPLYGMLTIFLLFKIMTENVNRTEIITDSFRVNIIEFFLLLFPCLYFFYDLLTNDSALSKNILRSPSFWITTGLFFYIIISLPFLLIGDKLLNQNFKLYNLMFSIHYISLSFLFLCITKAFSCKKTLTI